MTRADFDRLPQREQDILRAMATWEHLHAAELRALGIKDGALILDMAKWLDVLADVRMDAEVRWRRHHVPAVEAWEQDEIPELLEVA